MALHLLNASLCSPAVNHNSMGVCHKANNDLDIIEWRSTIVMSAAGGSLQVLLLLCLLTDTAYYFTH